MLRILGLTVGLLTAATATAADEAGDFDYYVLALSWSPSWCEAEGDETRAPQCDADSGLGFTLHGLWPQYESGWPEYCRVSHRDPSRRESGEMADIMGSGGLAWHQWKKHGRCSGLASQDYFKLARLAYGGVNRPPILRKLTEAIKVDPRVIEQAFLEANPDLSPDGVTITCRNGRLQEARICLTRNLEPRDCGHDVSRDCRLPGVRLPPVR